MDRTQDSRPISSDDMEWWTSLDEGYWQALLEQGETAPEIIPPTDLHEAFTTLDFEMQTTPPGGPSTTEREDSGEAENGWQLAKLALDRGDVFCLRISGANRGGLLVDWNGLQGFVPASHLKEMPRVEKPRERIAELARHIGESIKVRLIEVDPQQNRLVFSERATMADMAPSAILNSLKPGELCQGTVTNLTSFGAFVDLGGVEGLIHISELSWDRVRNPGDVLRPGQEVKVCVLGVNPEEGRIALSLKRLRPNPWLEVDARYHVGQLLEGKVTNVVSFGAFVRIEEGVEGLIHISELAEGNFLHPRNVVREGDIVRVRVLNIDPANQRLGLSLRQVHDFEYPASGRRIGYGPSA
jgi:small subunit ribosomal protein S1